MDRAIGELTIEHQQWLNGYIHHMEQSQNLTHEEAQHRVLTLALRLMAERFHTRASPSSSDAEKERKRQL